MNIRKFKRLLGAPARASKKARRSVLSKFIFSSMYTRPRRKKKG